MLYSSQVQALADYTFTAKYAMHNKQLKRRETWEEALQRSYDMHKERYSNVWDQLRPLLDEAYEAYKDKLVVGSQRNLQFSGPAVLKKNARAYNCTASYCDRLRFFQEAMYLLLCGCGVGFSVQKHHVEKLPEFLPIEKTEIKIYSVEDSIEGWANSIGVLVGSYFKNDLFPEYSGKVVKFDYSPIRPEGSEFSHGIGTAPGHKPLQRTHEKIRELLDRCVLMGQKRLNPIDAYDIVMHSSDAVLAGGIRRSACIAIFSHDDLEMMNAKTGNWGVENPQRARSNNSALILRDATTKEEFHKLLETSKQFGEPGFFWSDSTESICNPCVTGDTLVNTEMGWIPIKELAERKKPVVVSIDSRIGMGDIINKTNFGCKTSVVSKIKLTQKNAPIYLLTTSDGREIKVTENHEFSVIGRGRIKVKDLKINDLLLTPSGVCSFGKNGTYDEGFLLGALAGDGSIGDNVFLDIWEDDFDTLAYFTNLINLLCKKSSPLVAFNQSTPSGGKKKKRIGGRTLKKWVQEYIGNLDVRSLKREVPSVVFRGSKELVSGYLAGFMMTDGTVGISPGRINARFCQANKKLLRDIQILTSGFGLSGKIYKRSEAGDVQFRPSEKVYKQKIRYELIFNREDCIKMLSEKIITGRKGIKLSENINSGYVSSVSNKKNQYTTKVKSIEFIGNEDVYCLYEPSSNSFLANGLVSGNCLEILMYCYDEFGNSGWQFCNLSSINGSKIKNKDDFLKAARAATIIGTVQAGYINFPYLGEVTERICRKEALLGVSITGVMESAKVLLNPEIQKEVALSTIATNEEVAKIIGINPAARITCIKPEGSVSCMLGTSSGIHPHHSRKYIRRVQANKNEPPVKFYKELNPIAVEDSMWSANNSDYVIAFACDTKVNFIVKKDVTALDMLSKIKSTQENWVTYGRTVSRCAQPWLNHNVSNTVTVKPEEWKDVEDYIYTNRNNFVGVSLLSSSGDKDYVQAPFSEVLEPSEIVEIYGDASIFASGLIEDALRIFDGNLWKACDHVLGRGEDLGEKKLLDHEEAIRQQKHNWIQRVNKFSRRYHEYDLKKTTYLLKDVYNYKKWLDIKMNYKKVDYTDMVEETNSTVGSQELACAGGQCTI